MTRPRADVGEAEFLQKLSDIARVKVDPGPLGDDAFEVGTPPAHDTVFLALRASLDDLRKLGHLLGRKARLGIFGGAADSDGGRSASDARGAAARRRGRRRAAAGYAFGRRRPPPLLPGSGSSIWVSSAQSADRRPRSVLPLGDGLLIDSVALRQRPQARLTMQYRSTDRLCRCGATMSNLARSASFESRDKNAP
jgi:hypothetical protein